MPPRPLVEGLLVVALEQAVAAPICTLPARRRRRAGDQDRAAGGRLRPRLRRRGARRASYFVWLNRGKELVVLDLARDDDKALLAAMLAQADVFVQNLKPGAVAKLGFAIERLRARASAADRLLDLGLRRRAVPMRARKAYDLLVQAEVGLASVTGGPEAPARVGVSVVRHRDRHERLRGDPRSADRARAHRRGRRHLRVSMFDAMADWMTVPLLQHEGGKPPQAHRPRAHVDRALRRVPQPRRRRHPDLDPERPRMARARREGAGRCGARGRSGFRHQRRAGEAPRRDRRPRWRRCSARSTSTA